MRVVRLAITNFLSYPRAEATFSDGINLITGENASGKTNLIDSIFYASVGRTSRQSKDKELLNWEAKSAGARVTIQLKKRFTNHEIDIYIDPQGKKRILVDRLPITRMGELMGHLNVVFFSPTEMGLIKEGPSERRRFLDIGLSQQKRAYFYALQRYNQCLVQRNKVLKMHKGKPTLANMLKLTDPTLCELGAQIIGMRKAFVAELTPLAHSQHKRLTGDKEELSLLYETDILGDDLKKGMQEALQRSYPMDTKLDFTTVGPHRDDIKIASNSIDLRKYGSQGQQRTAVLSLKLAEIEWLEARTGEKPVLILDDVLSELDEGRKTALLEAIRGVQTFITATECGNVPLTTNDKLFEVRERALHFKPNKK